MTLSVGGLKRLRVHHVLLGVMLFFFIFSRVYNLGSRPINWDEGDYFYNAVGLLRGKTPYVDLYFSKPPLYYYLLSGFLLLLGRGLFEARLLPVLVDLLTFLMVYFLGKRLYGQHVGLLASFFYAISFTALVYGCTSKPNMLATFFTVLTLYFLYAAREKDSPYLYCASGVIASLTLLTRIDFAVPLLLLPLLIALSTFRRGQRGVSFINYLLYYLSTLLVSVAFMLILLSQGATLYTVYFHTVGLHQAGIITQSIFTKIHWLRVFIQTDPLFALGSLAYLLMVLRDTFKGRRTEAVQALTVYGWIVPSFLWCLSFPKIYLGYFLPLIPMMAVASSKMFVRVFKAITSLRKINRKRERGLTSVVYVSLTLILMLALTAPEFNEDVILIAENRNMVESGLPVEEVLEVSKYLQDYMGQDDEVLVFSAPQALAAALAGRSVVLEVAHHGIIRDAPYIPEESERAGVPLPEDIIDRLKDAEYILMHEVDENDFQAGIYPTSIYVHIEAEYEVVEEIGRVKVLRRK